jgi:hypothetical protein
MMSESTGIATPSELIPSAEVRAPAALGKRLGMAAAMAVLLAAGHGAATWVSSYLYYPNDPFSLRVLLRPGGDADYYPIVERFAQGNLGEPCYLESYGQGIDPFPVCSMLPHATCIRLLGQRGYLVADLLVNVAFLGALWLLLRAFSIGPVLALCAALAVTVGLPSELLTPLGRSSDWFREILQLNFWDARIPRAFVTGVYLILVWTCLIRLATDQEYPRRLRSWLWLGLSLSLLLQGETFAAVNCAILAAMAAAAALFRNRKDGRRLLLYAALGAAAFALASAPFFAQQHLAHPDAVRRYGVFPVPRTAPLVSLACHKRLTGTGLLTAAAFLFLPGFFTRHGPERAAGGSAFRRFFPGLPGQAGTTDMGNRVRLQLFCVGVAVVVSFLALPISCVVLGKAGQVYHFDTIIEVVCSYALLVLLLMVLQGPALHALGRLAARWPARLRAAGITATVSAALLACLAMVVCQAVRPPPLSFRWLSYGAAREQPRPSAERYWTDYRAMLGRLRESHPQRAEVLGAFDTQVLDWWSAFGPHWCFVAPAYVTTGSDQVQEHRLLLFCRLLGLRDEQLPGFLQLFYIDASVLGNAKYQASRAYTFSPLDDYDPAVRARIRKKSVDDGWHLAIPNGELRRLARSYARTSLSDHAFRWPEVIVLNSYERSLGLYPPTEQFDEVYRNPTFTVWRRREANPPPTRLSGRVDRQSTLRDGTAPQSRVRQSSKRGNVAAWPPRRLARHGRVHILTGRGGPLGTPFQGVPPGRRRPCRGKGPIDNHAAGAKNEGVARPRNRTHHALPDRERFVWRR